MCFMAVNDVTAVVDIKTVKGVKAVMGVAAVVNVKTWGTQVCLEEHYSQWDNSRGRNIYEEW